MLEITKKKKILSMPIMLHESLNCERCSLFLLAKFGFPPELQQGPKFSNIYLFFPSIRMTFTCASVGCLACRELLDVVFLCMC